MQEEKEQESSESASDAGGTNPPDSATSSETLSEIEQTEKVHVEKSEGGGSPMPSPDGAFDSDGGGRGPQDDPGPM